MATRHYFDRKKISILPDSAHAFINGVGRMWEKHRLAKKFEVTTGYIEWVWDGCPELVYKSDEVFEEKDKKEHLGKKQKEDREAVAFMGSVKHYVTKSKHFTCSRDY